VEQVSILPVNDGRLKEPRNVASAFSNFFITITEKLNIRQIEKRDGTSILKDSFRRNFPSMKIIPITKA
jgi:hypothetical protein